MSNAPNESEQRFRALVEATSCVVYVSDRFGNIPDADDWTHYTGQGSAEHLASGWLNVVHPDDRDAAAECWRLALRDGKVYESHHRLRRPDGTYSPVISRAVPLRDAKGVVREWVGCIQDVTQLRVSEQQARERLQQLEQAQRDLLAKERMAAVGELAAAVAHEVRNPLGAILNALNVVSRTLEHPLFRIMREECDRLNYIVKDLIDFARPFQPQFEVTSLGEVIKQAAQSVDLEAGNVKFVHLSPAGEDGLRMDVRLVRQALINLFENAVQAMPTGGTLTVRTTRAEQTLDLTVSDTGHGIPEHLHQRVFDPFFTTKATGTGLGLAVVKRIVDSHAAETRLRQAEGGGCEIQIRFPCADVEAPAAQARA